MNKNTWLTLALSLNLLVSSVSGLAAQSSEKDQGGMDHSQMDHSQMDHSKMDHSKTNKGQMKHSMTFDKEGMVMNTNEDKLPGGCNAISGEVDFTVRAGTKYANTFNGDVFGMDTHEFKVKPCSKVNITFINEDAIRHQFMVHGLPKYIYPVGMFHIEAAGGATKQGSFIVPGENKTYLVHCDLAQHMEKGMKAQLVVGSGGADLTSVPGISAKFRPDTYVSTSKQYWAMFGGLLLSVFLVTVLIKRFD